MKHAAAARRMNLHTAIDRLASLYEYGHLLLGADPAAVIKMACDEIERSREARRRERG